MRARGFVLATLLLVAALVGLTCGVLLEHPQLEPDDYRYLRIGGDVLAGRDAGLPAFGVVENRWDHLWFVPDRPPVRFYRPAFVASFLPDVGPEPAAAVLRTNLLLHLGACLLAAAWFLRWLGPGLPALLASALFTAFVCHAEAVWYGCGRNEPIAGMLVLLVLLAHGGSGPRRWLGLPAFAAALLAKELTALLPLVLLAVDVGWHARGSWRAVLRQQPWLWGGYLLVLGAYATLRTAVLGLDPAAMQPPYFVPPWADGFAAHLWIQFRSYGENLLLGRPSPPFLVVDRLADHASAGGLLLELLALGLGAWLAFRDRRARALVLLLLLAWLPASTVYVSERYLWLPSLAVAGLLGLWLQRQAVPWRRAAVLLLGALWGGHQAFLLQQSHVWISHAPRPALAVAMGLERLLPTLPRGAHLLLVSFPGDVVHAQFVQDQLRVLTGDPTLCATVLTLAPDGPTGATSLRVVGEQSLELRAPCLMRAGGVFPSVPFRPDARYSAPRGGVAAVRVLDGDGGTLRALRCDLDVPVAATTVVQWLPPDPWPVQALQADRILDGRFAVVQPEPGYR